MKDLSLVVRTAKSVGVCVNVIVKMGVNVSPDAAK